MPSSGLFGRDRELVEADETLAHAVAGTPKALLLGGDAGIGKTTLVAGVATRARELGFVVLTGHCLDIDNGVPLQPVREALRGAVTGRDVDSLPPVTGRLADFLLGGKPDESANPAAVLEDLSQVVRELAAESPLLVVLEDMHWADRSTQDFAVSLSRTMQGPVCLVLTYRSDELTRRHPFRRALVELGRSVGARRIDLPPLDRVGISGIVEVCTGRPDPALVGSLLARCEGNPLYAEELLQAGPHALPGPLSDLLLARVDALSGSTRDLLRLASVGGSRLDPPLLAEVAQLDEDALDACLREGIDANVLRVTGDHLDFRHGLLREAIYDDLLPSERTRAHARMAATMQAQLGADAAMSELGLLAFHWYAAHDQAEAFRASVRAGMAARTYGGPEAVTHLERALELYDQVADETGKLAKADLVRLLAEACKEHGEHDRAGVLMREALEHVGEDTERLLASRVYSSYAVLCEEFEGQLGHHEAIERAIEYAAGPPSEELATALSMMAGWHMRGERIAGAIEYADQAIEVAAAVPVPVVESVSLQYRGWAHYYFGRIEQALADFDAAARAAVRGGSAAEAAYSELHRISLLGEMPHSQGALAPAAELRARTRAQGLPEVAQHCGIGLTVGLLEQGRLDEADLLLSELVDEGMSPDHYRWRAARSRLLLFRGDAAAALPLERQTIALWRTVVVLPDWWDVIQHVQVLDANELSDEAIGVVHEHMQKFRHVDATATRAGVAMLGYLGLAIAQRAGRPLDQDLLAQADELLARATEASTDQAQKAWLGSHLLLAVAHRADLFGEPSVEQWRAAYDACSAIGAGHALQTRLGLAAALVAAGDKEQARIVLPELWSDAKAMGAEGYADRAALLARRHRIPLPDGQVPNRLDILTAREREVLEVLATGATNRDIAERLFISQKTVSVHVSNLMAKLGVPNRGAAAALARDLTPAE